MYAHPYDNHLVPALGKTPFGGPPQQYRLIPQEGKPQFSTQTSWEAPDPNFWVPAGYAVVNMNLPGFANSGGRPSLGGAEQVEAFAEAIDWIGARPWCTGAVGLNGVSFLAISQSTTTGRARCRASRTSTSRC
jgi:putative CocE/NonD family hydrolase